MDSASNRCFQHFYWTSKTSKIVEKSMSNLRWTDCARWVPYVVVVTFEWPSPIPPVPCIFLENALINLYNIFFEYQPNSFPFNFNNNTPQRILTMRIVCVLFFFLRKQKQKHTNKELSRRQHCRAMNLVTPGIIHIIRSLEFHPNDAVNTCVYLP